MLVVNSASVTLSAASSWSTQQSVLACGHRSRMGRLGWGSSTSKLRGRLSHKHTTALIADVLVGVVRSSQQSFDTHGSTFWLHQSAIGAITVITALKPGNLYKACSSETARVVALMQAWLSLFAYSGFFFQPQLLRVLNIAIWEEILGIP